ncbi:PadR family transcriptional regulator [Deinococcus pimensis]|uniref:PadR family transcriptional regulator n=1 Tax=Deinococcus pimensis TaxID=309888 RepID=UPI0004B8AA25|nr:PadR family transcriptional regulator [Deinococcus pimensis]
MNVTALGYVLLGLLARESRSGYDLAQNLRRPVGFFWAANHSQIYPQLARLEEEGLVEHEVVDQRDRPAKKVYTLTPRGRETLRTWLVEPLTFPTYRDELTLKAYSLWLADRVEAARMLREHAEEHRAREAVCQTYVDDLTDHASEALTRVDTPEFAAYVAAQRGVSIAREARSWCLWVARLLEAQTPLTEAQLRSLPMPPS